MISLLMYKMSTTEPQCAMPCKLGWLAKARLSYLLHVESRLVLIECSRAWPMSTAQSHSTHAMEPPFTWKTSLS